MAQLSTVSELQDLASVPVAEPTAGDDLDLTGDGSYAGAIQFEQDTLASSEKLTQRSLKIIVISCVVFAVAVTIALGVSIKFDPYQVVESGAVVSEAPECSAVGAALLRRGGAAVDAAVGALLCLGVVHPHTSGLGGGGFMIVRQHAEGLTQAINFQEVAPLGWHTTDTTDKPGLYVGVPGLLRGLEVAHKQFGKLSWRDVVNAAADVAADGFNMSQSLFDAFNAVNFSIRSNDANTFWLRDDGSPIQPGEGATRPALAATLRRVAREGASVIYTGEIANNIVTEVNRHGGILTTEDLKIYEADKVDAIRTTFKNRTVETTPAPSSGPLLLCLLNMLENVTLATGEDDDYNATTVFYHRLLESMKFVEGQRLFLGDPAVDDSVANFTKILISKAYAATLVGRINETMAFSDARHYGGPVADTPDDFDATHVTVIGPHDDYVSVSSSLNHPFGSRILTIDGIILNSQMAEFDDVGATPNDRVVTNKRNLAVAGKRPLSSLLSALIHTDRRPCLRVALGCDARNKTTIFTSLAQVIARLLTAPTNMSAAIDAPRLHSTLRSDGVRGQYEEALPADVVASLRGVGHDLTAVVLIGEVDIASKNKETVSVYTDRRGNSAETVL